MADAATPPKLTRDESHIYRLGNRVVPGVTQVLKSINELEGVDPRFLERAAQFGRHVDRACQLWDYGALDEERLDPGLRGHLNSWINFLKDTGAKVIESRLIVYHPRLHIAGELDYLLAWNISPRPVLVDIKTNSSVLRASRAQTALYKDAYEAMTGTKIAKARKVVHLLGEGRYDIKSYSDDGDLHIGISCLNIHNWINQTR